MIQVRCTLIGSHPYSIQQLQVEVAILRALTLGLKAGTLHRIPPASGKVYHIGHSFASILSHALVAADQHLSDGIVLTGYSTNLTWEDQFMASTGFHLARENQPSRFAGQSSGYLTWGDSLANQYSFFSYPFFDPAVLVKAEATKFPFSIGEILTTATPPIAAAFTGPVLAVSGDADNIFCNGDCYGILPRLTPFFLKSRRFESYVQPHTGHCVNLHFNASGFYEVVQNFLAKEG
ncbi:hypothetical protein LTR49_022513 [Elasticomyces elasticus]|nr:hypothetical protein LTR49_022513 [Elasticomyces elasticus]